MSDAPDGGIPDDAIPDDGVPDGGVPDGGIRHGAPDPARAAVEAARALAAASAARLRAAGARDEALAEFVPERRTLGIVRAARMAPLGRVWRLGVLLLGTDGGLFATGRVVRAERPVRRSILANSVAEHRAYRAAAIKGGFAEGTTVDFDAPRIDFDALAQGGASGPLLRRGDRMLVRWSPTQPDALADFADYLLDRVGLLADPPEGA